MNRSPWQVLGIEPGADARTIKRAYARLLKEVRPDANPDRFQWVRWAYENALAMAAAAERGVAIGSDDDDGSEREYEDVAVAAPPVHQVVASGVVVPHAPPVQVAPVAAVVPLRAVADVALPEFRPTHVVCATLRAALFEGKEALVAALDAAPELMSLVERPAIEDQLLRSLLEDGRVPTREAFEALAACFHWNEIGVGAQRLRDRDAGAFDRYVRGIAAHEEVVRRARIGRGAAALGVDAFAVRMLLTPWAWWKWLYVLVPRAWTVPWQRLMHLRSYYGRIVDSVLDAGAVRRMDRLADRFVPYWEQLAVTAARCLVFGAPLVWLNFRVGVSSDGERALAAVGQLALFMFGLDAVRFAFHWFVRGVRRLGRWIADDAMPALRAHWWALPSLRLLLASLLPAAGWSWGEGEWALYNAFGMVLLAAMSRTSGLAVLDVVGALIWSVALRMTLDWPSSDMGAMLALGYVVAAVMRELSLWAARSDDGDDFQFVFAWRGVAQLAAPVALCIVMSYVRG
ncbi:MAG TPA: hypothetical protein VFL14_08940 [Xanthomonadales bacterium]|nr:hypothetical protein [Xanthomonadales bacterium]